MTISTGDLDSIAALIVALLVLIQNQWQSHRSKQVKNTVDNVETTLTQKNGGSSVKDHLVRLEDKVDNQASILNDHIAYAEAEFSRLRRRTRRNHRR